MLELVEPIDDRERDTARWLLAGSDRRPSMERSQRRTRGLGGGEGLPSGVGPRGSSENLTLDDRLRRGPSSVVSITVEDGTGGSGRVGGGDRGEVGESVEYDEVRRSIDAFGSLPRTLPIGDKEFWTCSQLSPVAKGMRASNAMRTLTVEEPDDRGEKPPKSRTISLYPVFLACPLSSPSSSSSSINASFTILIFSRLDIIGVEGVGISEVGFEHDMWFRDSG
jgi:hypothetical protein